MRTSTTMRVLVNGLRFSWVSWLKHRLLHLRYVNLCILHQIQANTLGTNSLLMSDLSIICLEMKVFSVVIPRAFRMRYQPPVLANDLGWWALSITADQHIHCDDSSQGNTCKILAAERAGMTVEFIKGEISDQLCQEIDEGIRSPVQVPKYTR